MGEKEYASSIPTQTADDMAEHVFDYLHAGPPFLIAKESAIDEVALDANATINITLKNGQTFRATFEENSLESTGTH